MQVNYSDIPCCSVFVSLNLTLLWMRADSVFFIASLLCAAELVFTTCCVITSICRSYSCLQLSVPDSFHRHKPCNIRGGANCLTVGGGETLPDV